MSETGGGRARRRARAALGGAVIGLWVVARYARFGPSWVFIDGGLWGILNVLDGFWDGGGRG